MKEELEICVKVLVPFKEIINDMLEKGFHVQEEFQLNDIYMVPKDKEISLKEADKLLSNYVLVRETVGKRIMLTLKNKEINSKGEIVKQSSVKCQITNSDDGYKFMKELGYKKMLEIKDHNILLSNGKNEIYVQDVEGLGAYVEMEQKNLLLDNNNGNSIEEMINTLNSYDLKIDKSNYFAKKSYDMLKIVIDNK